MPATRCRSAEADDLGRTGAHRRRRSPGSATGRLCLRHRVNGYRLRMDEATLQRATEPFFTTKGSRPRHGLGLSMVDGLVAQSGGAMRIRSKPGHGTEVELWLPVTDAPRAEGKALAAAPSPRPRGPPVPRAGRRRRCHRPRRNRGMLEDLGPFGDRGGIRGARPALLETGPDIDLVITDYAMPGMNGSRARSQKFSDCGPGFRSSSPPATRTSLPKGRLCLGSTNPIGSRISAALIARLVEPLPAARSDAPDRPPARAAGRRAFAEPRQRG